MSDTKRTTYPNKKASLTVISLFFILCLTAFSFGATANTYSNSWFTQLSNSGANIYVEFPDDVPVNEWYLETRGISNDNKYQHIKACDINRDGIKELLFYQTGSNTIYYLNGADNTLSTTQSFNLPSTYGVDEVTCVGETNGNYDNILISMYSSSLVQTKVAEYYFSNNALAAVTNYLEIAGDDYRNIYGGTQCKEYSQSGFNYYNCAYPLNYSDGGYHFLYISKEGYEDSTGSTDYYFRIKSDDAEAFFAYEDSQLRRMNGESTAGVYGINESSEVSSYRRFGMGGITGDKIVYISDGNATTNQPIVAINAGSCDTYLLSNACSLYTEDFTVPLDPTIPYTYRYSPNYFDNNFGNKALLGDIMTVYSENISTTSPFYCITGDPQNSSSSIGYICYTLSSILNDPTENVGLRTAQTSAANTNFNYDGVVFTYSGAIDNEQLSLGYSEEICTAYRSDVRILSYCYGVEDDTLVNVRYEGAADSTNDYTDMLIGVLPNNTVLLSTTDAAGGYTLDLIESDSDNRNEITDDFPDLATTNGVFYFEDISGDSIGEIIFVTDDGISVLFLQGDEPAVITTYGSVVHNYYNPTCTNSTVTFEMTECVGTTDCTYTTDSANPYEQERICTSCGGTQTYACGSYSLNNPQITCSNFSVAQTLNIDFDMYTTKDINTIAESFTLEDLVISNSACNQTADFVDTDTVGGVAGDVNQSYSENITVVTPTTAIPTYDDPDDLITEFLSGTSVLWRIVIGLAIVIGLIVTVAQTVGRNANPSLYVVVGILGLIVVTAIGFLPAYILIIGLISMVLLVIVGKYIGSTGGS